MGQAKLKKQQQAQALAAVQSIDREAFAHAVRRVVEASTEAQGADCVLYALVGAAALRQMGVPAQAVAGSAAWRVGPGDSDVITHAREVTGPVFAQSHLDRAMAFHAWIEAPGFLIDLTTHTLRLKAAQLDEADGGTTNVEWAPEFIWMEQGSQPGRQREPIDVVRAMDAGQFCYVRHADVEVLALPASAREEIEGSGAVSAVAVVYQSILAGESIRVVSVDEDGSTQDEPQMRELVRWDRPRG